VTIADFSCAESNKETYAIRSSAFSLAHKIRDSDAGFAERDAIDPGRS
jgi:hypothetical protein